MIGGDGGGRRVDCRLSWKGAPHRCFGDGHGDERTEDVTGFTRRIVGGAVGAALWAVLGTGIDTLVRGQIAAVGGLCVWILLIENLVVGNIPSVAKYTPGAGAGALAGLTPNAGSTALLAPAVGALLLAGYAASAAALGLAAIERRDVA